LAGRTTTCTSSRTAQPSTAYDFGDDWEHDIVLEEVLGLDGVSEFDPAHFDVDEVNGALGPVGAERR